MQSYRIASVILIALALALNLAECGPARSIAMAAQRSSKIPISIRAPFRHSETMIARGYGKRSSLISQAGKMHGNDLGAAMAWGYGKRDATNFLDDGGNDGTNENSVEQVVNDSSQSDGVPLEWIASELALNPGLLKAILYRFVDTNKDGLLSPQEFMGTTNDSNNSF